MVKPNVMDASDLVRMLNATHYAPAHLEQVKNLCRNYPMFSLAHMLKVRILESLGRDKERELKLAAVYACDRSALHRLVSEVNEPPVREEAQEEVHEEPVEPDTGIQFSEEPDEHADVIIEQHAPYAAPPSSSEELLELDEGTEDQDQGTEDQDQGTEDQDQKTELDQEPGTEDQDQGTEDQEQAFENEEDEELSSETLIESVVKEEADMEETGEGKNGVPAIDRVEKEEDNEDDGKASGLPKAADMQKQGAGNHLIRDFISQEPGPIRPDWETSLKGDVSKTSAIEHDGFITDTLAKIYVKQGLYAKAIYAYEKLSLKYPEKSAYFAAQIDKIKNINHS